MHDPDYWKFSNEDGKLERCDMRQFKADLDSAIKYQKERGETMKRRLRNSGAGIYDDTAGVKIALCQTVEIAMELTRIVNSHESLVDALRCAQSDIRQLRLQLFGNSIEGPAQAQIAAALALAEAGTVAKFRFKVGQRVYWTDPENLTSGYGTIEKINGEDDPDSDEDTVISLKMDDGGEVEAVPHELAAAESVSDSDSYRKHRMSTDVNQTA